jgi:hypothetical protein
MRRFFLEAALALEAYLAEVDPSVFELPATLEG